MRLRRAFALAIAFVSIRANGGSYANAVLADRPIAYYRLNETTGTTAIDSSGNHRDGRYINVALGAAGALGSGDGAATFIGSNSYVSLPGSWGGTAWREITVEGWVNVRTVASDFQAIVSSTGGSFVHFQVHTFGNVALYTDTLSYVPLPIPAPAPLSTWRHIAVVGQSGNSRIYVDGVQFGAASGAAFSYVLLANEVRIGSGFAGRFFNGLLDEVAIYDHALPQSRIQAHIAARSDTGPSAGTTRQRAVRNKPGEGRPPTGGNAELTDGERMAVAQEISRAMTTAMLNAFSAPRKEALALVYVPISGSVACNGGGRIQVSGSISGSIDDNGSGALFTDARETVTDCRFGGNIFNGDPYFSFAGTFSFLNGAPATQQTLLVGGGFKWLTPTGATGACGVNLTSNLNMVGGYGNISGTMCGRFVNANF